MPFVDERNNDDDKYLRDGVADSVITNLGQLPQISIKARSSSFSSRFKGDNFNAKKIGQELNVQAFITGSLIKSENGLLLYIELVSVQTETPLLRKYYRYKTNEVVSLPSTIALDIAHTLVPTLSISDELKISKNHTANEEAYQLYSKGMSYLNERSGESIEKAIIQFKASTKKDPNYALAFVGLANCYVLLHVYGGISSSETLPLAKEYAMRAIAIDEFLVEAHATLGLIYLDSWQWVESENEFKRAIDLNPNYPATHQWYHILLRNLNLLDEAKVEINRAKELDPFSPLIDGNIAYYY